MDSDWDLRMTHLRGSKASGRLRDASVSGWLLAAAFSLTLLGGIVYAQNDLPYSPDDLQFGQILTAKGYPDLAVEVYRRVERSPEATEELKLQASLALLEAYRVMATEVPDPTMREHWLKEADDQAQKLAGQFEGETLPIEVLYAQGELLQTQGRSAAAELSRVENTDDRAALVKRSNDYFNRAVEVFRKVQEQAIEQEKQLSGDREKNKDALQKMLESRIKGALKLAWTRRYQALLYPENSNERSKGLADAIGVFNEFINAYPTDMSVLSAYYARGQCQRDLGKPDEGMADFKTIIDHTAGVVEVADLRVQCGVLWADLATRQGKYDEALKTLDDVLKDGQELAGRQVREGAVMQKARTLAVKAGSVKATDAQVAKDLYQQALALVRPVVLGGSENAGKANEFIVQVLKDSGIELKLDPVEKLALAESYLAAQSYGEAAKLLEECVNATGEIEGMPIGFKARLLLGKAYRWNKEYEKSLAVFDQIPKLYPGRDELPDVALERCWTLGLYARDSRKPEIDEQYTQSLKELADTYPNSPQGMNARYYYGETQRQRGNYLAAAQAYEKLPSDYHNYGRAQFLQGLSYYKAWYQRVRAGQNDEEAREYRLKAEGKLKECVSELAPRPRETWNLDAAVTLADLYGDAAQYEEMLQAVQMFAQRYPEEAKTSPDLVYRKMQAMAALNRLGEAEKELELLSQQQAEAATLARGYLTLADTYLRKGDTQRADNDLDGAKASDRKALDLLKKATAYVDPASADLWAWIAGKAFRLNDPESSLAAADQVEKAYANREADDKLWAIRLLELRSMKLLNRWDDRARKLLDQLMEKYPGNAEIMMERAALLFTDRKVQEALDIYEKVVLGVRPGTDLYFRAQLNKGICYHELGDDGRAREVVKTTRGLYPNVGGPEMKAQFADLEGKLK